MFYQFVMFAMNQSLKIPDSYKTITTVAIKGISKLTNYFKTNYFVIIFMINHRSTQLSVNIIFR